jgi:hypothetical protein
MRTSVALLLALLGTALCGRVSAAEPSPRAPNSADRYPDHLWRDRLESEEAYRPRENGTYPLGKRDSAEVFQIS